MKSLEKQKNLVKPKKNLSKLDTQNMKLILNLTLVFISKVNSAKSWMLITADWLAQRQIRFLNIWKASAYDQTYQSTIRKITKASLVIREGINTGQLLVNLSVSDENLKDQEQSHHREQFLETIKNDPLLKQQVTTMVISYNNGLADIVNAPEVEMKTFRGDGYIYEKLDFTQLQHTQEECLVNFRVSPSSFFQTNTLGAQKLFSTAIKMTGHIEGNILDLYCGAGSIGLSLLKQGLWEELVWVEIVEKAIIDARYNAKINGVEDKCYFVASPAEKMLINFPELKEKIQNIWLVVIDPPREWLHPNVIKYLSDLKKEYDFKLLYISCNPITMARDIELLVEEDFKFQKIQAVDMFPHTHHIECISVLS